MLLRHLGNTNGREECVWIETDRDRWMDRLTERRKKWEKKREVHDVKDRYKRRVDRCSAVHLFMSKQRSACMCRRKKERERLMDGLVYTARGVQGGGERGISV